jgi:hypothetical protein
MTEYRLSRAKIENLRIVNKENQYLCRVLPDMQDILETNLLPYYPSFLRTYIEAYENNDIVWVLHTEDFQIGYVIGLSESSKGRDLKPLLDQINEIETKFKFALSDIKNITFTIAKGAYLDFSNNLTGVSGRINKSGSTLLFGEDGNIYISSLASSIMMEENGDMNIKNINEIHETDKNFVVNANEIIEVSKTRIMNSESKIDTISGDSKRTVMGSNQEAFAKNSTQYFLSKKEEIVGLGSKKQIMTGGESIQIVQGDYEVLVALGKINLNSALGVNITAGATGLKIVSAGPVDITSSALNIKSPLIKFPSGVSAPSGSGPFCALPVCLFTGAPHVGNVFAGV